MLVKSRVTASSRLDSLHLAEEKLRCLEVEVQERRSELMKLHRSKDLELTQMNKIHEEKLFGLLEHSPLGQLFADKYHQGEVSSSSRFDPKVDISDASPEQIRAFLRVSNESMSFLKSEVCRLTASSENLEEIVYLKEYEIIRLENTLIERAAHMKFVEEECALFKDIAEDLRTGMIAVSGDSGGPNIKQFISAHSRERMHMYDEDDEEEAYNNENLFEFTSLADEIQKTGDVAVTTVKPGPVTTRR